MALPTTTAGRVGAGLALAPAAFAGYEAIKHAPGRAWVEDENGQLVPLFSPELEGKLSEVEAPQG